MFALALLPLLPLISAGRTFIGCSNSVGGGNFESPNAYSAAECASKCDDFGTAAYGSDAVVYSYFSSFYEPPCACSTSGPASFNIQTSAYASDVCSSNFDLSVYQIHTTFAFDQCYQGTPTGPSTSVNAIKDCFNTCKSSTTLLVKTSPATGQFLCYCQDQTDTPNACTPSTAYYRFTHSLLQASQGLARRRKMRTVGGDQYCPAGLTACNVGAGINGYECLDTSSELESCGGCIHGQFGAKPNTAQSQGVICDDGMTCQAGHCVEQF